MYAAFWHVLPGPLWLRILITLVIVAALLFVLVTWIFPWIDSIVTGTAEGTVTA